MPSRPTVRRCRPQSPSTTHSSPGARTGTDAAALRQVAARLPASGLIASGARLIGHEPNQAALYAVPAEHYLPYPLAPARCVPANERSIVSDETSCSRPITRIPAICVFAVGGHEHGATPLTSCAPLTGAPEALLDAAGQPLLGLAPNGVDAVTARYLAAPVKTITVHDNFYEILGDSNQEPCGLEWLDESGNVTRSIEGCNYLGVEEPLLRTYRQQVSGQLAGVQSDVETMAMAIGAGNLAGAQADWLTAHTAWLQIGQDDGAYGAFGSLGGEIDGLSGGLAGGSASPDFTGFHKGSLISGEAGI